MQPALTILDRWVRGEAGGYGTGGLAGTGCSVKRVAAREAHRSEGCRAVREGNPSGAASVVAGDVPDRRRLLLYARVSTGYRGPGRRCALAGRYPNPGADYALR